MKIWRDKTDDSLHITIPEGETVTEIEAPKKRVRRQKVRALPHTINVTADVVANSLRADSSHCMIADAIKKQFPEARNVYVDLQSIRWTDSKKKVRFVYLTPRDAQIALLAFDRGEEPEPFEFRLTASMAQVVRSKAGTQPKGKRKMVIQQNGHTQIIDGPTPPLATLGAGATTSAHSPQGVGKRRVHGLGVHS